MLEFLRLEKLKEFKEILEFVGFTSIVALLGGLAKLYDRFRRSRLIKPVDLGLPRIPDTNAIYGEFPGVERWIPGREDDVHQLGTEIERNQLVFVRGPSGVGKSTMLKIGVCRDLHLSGRWLPIYVDFWGGDWVSGPWDGLAAQVQCGIDRGLTQEQRKALNIDLVNRSNTFVTLERIRSVCSRRPLIVFDQVDDYQALNSQRFLATDTRRLITPQELQDSNQFWREFSALLSRTKLAENEVHAVFSIRTDAEQGLDSFRFIPPAIYPLNPIFNADARKVLDTVIPVDAVQSPQNGFDQLKTILTNDLGGRNSAILPIRLRVAVAGLEKIRDSLTPATYERVGGLAGLEAGYIRDQISRCGGDPDEVLRLLVSFISSETGLTKTRRDLTREDLVKHLSLGAEDILKKLEQGRILLRRIAPELGERWSLYHDYLSNGIGELDRRRRKWSIFLNEAHARYESAPVSSRWAKLLTPGRQFIVWGERLRGGLEFGPARGYVLLSLARLAVNWVTVAILIVAGTYVFSIDARAKRSLGRFEGLSGGGNAAEMQELWSITTATQSFRDSFRAQLLSSEDARVKYHNMFQEFNRALTGLSRTRRDELAEILSRMIVDPKTSIGDRALLAKSVAALESGTKDSPAVVQTAQRLAQDIQASTIDSGWLTLLGKTLADLTSELTDPRLAMGSAWYLAGKSKERHDGGTVPHDHWVEDALASLSSAVPDSEPVRQTAKLLADDIEKGPDPDILREAGILAGLTENLHQCSLNLQPSIRLAQNAAAGRLLYLGQDWVALLTKLSTGLTDPDSALALAQQLISLIRDPKTDRPVVWALGKALVAACRNVKESATTNEVIRQLDQLVRTPGTPLSNRAPLAQALAVLSIGRANSGPTAEFLAELAREIRDPKTQFSIRDLTRPEAQDDPTRTFGPALTFVRELVSQIHDPRVDWLAVGFLRDTLNALRIKYGDSGFSLELARFLGKEILDPRTSPEVRAQLEQSLASLSADLGDPSPAALLAPLLARDIGSPAASSTTLRLTRSLARVRPKLQDPSSAEDAARKIARMIKDDPKIGLDVRVDLAVALAALSENARDTGPAREAARDLARRAAESGLDAHMRWRLAEGIAALSGSIKPDSEAVEMASVALNDSRDQKSVRCDALAEAARRNDLRVVIDLLQWPQCASDVNTDAILLVAERKSFGRAEKNRKFPNLNAFLSWAAAERSKGRTDLDLNRKPPNPFGNFWAWLD